MIPVQYERGGGVLVVRVWRDEATNEFRARVTSGVGHDLDARVDVLTTPEEVLDAVRRWLSAATAESSHS